MRLTLLCIIATTGSAASWTGNLCSTRVPALMAASGLRRSCPSTAMNCSRSSEAVRSGQQVRLRDIQSLLRLQLECDQLGEGPAGYPAPPVC